MAVKLRAINTCESCLAVNSHTAGIHMPVLVYHKRIERHHSGYAIFLCGHGRKLHHYHGVDNHAMIVFLSLIVDEIFHKACHHAMKTF